MTDQQHADALPGTWNFRDIGGIRAAGGVIRSGLVYRSAALAQLDRAGLRVLDDLGVSEVVDLRGAREIRREGADRVPEGVTVRVAPFHPEDDDTPAHEAQQDEEQQDGEQQDGEQQGARRDDYQPWTQADRLRRYYAEIPTLAPARQSVAALIRTVATGTGSVLVHCAAGKDRTGWAIAAVLGAAGADRDAVLADYLLSNDAIESLRAWMLAQYGQAALRAGDQVLGVDESYLQAGWDAADAAYGSFAGYLDAIGIDDAVLEQLRGRLVD